MRYISTKTHGALDYLIGALLIIVPLFYIREAGAAAWVPLIVGIVLLIQSLLTDYELSPANLIPMKVHLAMDGIAGLFLVLSPWLFGFAELIWLPHVIVGILEIGAAFMTELHRREPVDYPKQSRVSAGA